MDADETVAILLATYNGEAFLAEQLDSILAQTHSNWRLLVRDDRSEDGTPSIVRDYQHRFPGKIMIIEDGLGNLGVSKNFSELMGHADAGYVMFSDQDDVWLPTKIAVTLQKMKELESRFGDSSPLAVLTDLRVVDRQLRPLSDSCWKYQKTDPVNGAALNRLLVQNIGAGCAMMINRPLLRRAYPVADGAIMHDWWCALVATTFGKIEPLFVPTSLYRQHARNQAGTRHFGLRFIAKRFWALVFGEERARLHQNFAKCYRQGKELLQRYGNELTPKDRKMLEAYASLGQKGFFQRRYLTLRYRFFHVGLIRNIGWFLFG